MIPKRIFYVWLGKGELPIEVRNNINSWQENNPGYKIIQINEKNFDLSKYNFVKEAYDNRMWAFASDVIRLDVIYNNGGFYFDTDVKMVKPLDELRKYKSVWGMETPGLINSGLIIGANKYDDDIKELLINYNNLKFDKNNIEEMMTPYIVSNYFFNKGFKKKNKNQLLANGTYIFASKYFAPYHWWGGGKIKTETITIHQYEKTWEKESNSKSKINILPEIRYYFPVLFDFLSNIKKKVTRL